MFGRESNFQAAFSSSALLLASGFSLGDYELLKVKSMDKTWIVETKLYRSLFCTICCPQSTINNEQRLPVDRVY